MIKGVNKRVIEINNPDSIYFEKAIFYLKPNVRELPAEVTNREVNRYVSQLGLEYCARKKSAIRGKIIIGLIFLLALIAALAAFM